MTTVLVVPTWNRPDMLRRFLESVGDEQDQLVIVRNPHPVSEDIWPLVPIAFQESTSVICPGSNLGVAGSWNAALSHGYRKGKGLRWWGAEPMKVWDIAVVSNDDVVLPSGAVRKIVEDVQKVDNGIVVSQEDFSFFAITFSLWLWIGLFDDEFYPAYCEDLDWKYRMKLCGLDMPKRVYIPGLKHDRSSSRTPGTQDIWKRNKRRYEAKWGGKWMRETFKVPFEKVGNGVETCKKSENNLVTGKSESRS